MLRTRAEQVSWWESVLPAEVLRLPEELARVDTLLDDRVFFAPFVPFFDPRVGRPSPGQISSRSAARGRVTPPSSASASASSPTGVSCGASGFSVGNLARI